MRNSGGSPKSETIRLTHTFYNNYKAKGYLFRAPHFGLNSFCYLTEEALDNFQVLKGALADGLGKDPKSVLAKAVSRLDTQRKRGFNTLIDRLDHRPACTLNIDGKNVAEATFYREDQWAGVEVFASIANDMQCGQGTKEDYAYWPEKLDFVSNIRTLADRFGLTGRSRRIGAENCQGPLKMPEIG